MAELLSPDAWLIFLWVMGINVMLSGDNAIVIGLAAAGLPAEQRNKVILFGIGAATILRIIFALVATYLLQVTGLLLAGGLILLWVCWKMWHDIRTPHEAVENAEEALANEDLNQDHLVAGGVKKGKTFMEAARTIVIADVSMSLDNALAIAGAAREHPIIMAIGLGLSVVLMGLAASVIARLLQRYHWLSYVGLLAIFVVAGEMIWHGIEDILHNGEHAVELSTDGVDHPEGLPAEPASPAAEPAPVTPGP